MKTQKNKMLLFLNNATSHAYLELDNIKLISPPPKYNTDFSTFKSRDYLNFQDFYQNFVLHHLIANLDGTWNAQDLEKQIDVLKAVTWV